MLKRREKGELDLSGLDLVEKVGSRWHWELRHSKRSSCSSSSPARRGRNGPAAAKPAGCGKEEDARAAVLERVGPAARRAARQGLSALISSLTGYYRIIVL